MDNKKIKLIKNYILPFSKPIKTAISPKQKSFNNDETNCFFILGSGRNGSTLLALLLNRHNKVFLPPEQYVLPYSIIEWNVNILKSWNAFVNKYLKEYLTKNQDWRLNDEDYDKLLAQLLKLQKKHKNPNNLFKIIFNYYGNKSKNSLKYLGDHSPKTTEFFKEVYAAFPRSKFIFLIRHPFDVILSYYNMGINKASNPIIAAKKWNNSVSAYEFIKKINENQILIIKYEDLVNCPDQIISEILSFLDLEYIDLTKANNIESSTDPLGAGNKKYHQNLYKPINKDSMFKWEKELSPDIINITKPIIEKNALKYGYKL